MTEITKAIIPLAGMGTRHLPLSKAVPKEFLPLAEKPLLQYVVQEASQAGVKEVVFVVSADKKAVVEYFKKSPQLEKFLEERKQEDLLEFLSEIDALAKKILFSYVSDRPLGDGHAVLQARKLVGEEPCFVLYPDDVIEARVPCVAQLAQVFRTSQKPVIGLFELPQEKLGSYGVVAAEKIASRLFKIKQIVEKPQAGAAPSLLAIVGRSIVTPEVFDYLKKTRPNRRGEISLSETFGQMVKDGKVMYGHQCEGRWWECGEKEGWFKAFVYFAAKHPQYGREVREFMKEEKLI